MVSLFFPWSANERDDDDSRIGYVPFCGFMLLESLSSSVSASSEADKSIFNF